MFRFCKEKFCNIDQDDQPTETRKHVKRLVEELDVRSVCEIGSFTGSSARMFASFPQVEVVICVDPWRYLGDSQDEFGRSIAWPMCAGFPSNWFGMFCDSLRACEGDLWRKIVPIVGRSQEMASYVPKVDLVYIDGAHDYWSIMRDIQEYQLKAKKVICGDDHHKRLPLATTTDQATMVPCPHDQSKSNPCAFCEWCFPGVVAALGVLPNYDWEGKFWWSEVRRAG